MSVTRPGTFFRSCHQPAANWIAMHVLELLDGLGCSIYVEVVITALPEVSYRSALELSRCLPAGSSPLVSLKVTTGATAGFTEFDVEHLCLVASEPQSPRECFLSKYVSSSVETAFSRDKNHSFLDSVCPRIKASPLNASASKTLEISFPIAP